MIFLGNYNIEVNYSNEIIDSLFSKRKKRIRTITVLLRLALVGGHIFLYHRCLHHHKIID